MKIRGKEMINTTLELQFSNIFYITWLHSYKPNIIYVAFFKSKDNVVIVDTSPGIDTYVHAECVYTNGNRYIKGATYDVHVQQKDVFITKNLIELEKGMLSFIHNEQMKYFDLLNALAIAKYSIPKIISEIREVTE